MYQIPDKNLFSKALKLFSKYDPKQLEFKYFSPVDVSTYIKDSVQDYIYFKMENFENKWTTKIPFLINEIYSLEFFRIHLFNAWIKFIRFKRIEDYLLSLTSYLEQYDYFERTILFLMLGFRSMNLKKSDSFDYYTIALENAKLTSDNALIGLAYYFLLKNSIRTGEFSNTWNYVEQGEIYLSRIHAPVLRLHFKLNKGNLFGFCGIHKEAIKIYLNIEQNLKYFEDNTLLQTIYTNLAWLYMLNSDYEKSKEYILLWKNSNPYFWPDSYIIEPYISYKENNYSKCIEISKKIWKS